MILSDLHLGYSDYLLSKGIYSLISESNMIKEITKKINDFKIDVLVFNGDIIHDFGSFPRRLKNRIFSLVSQCREHNCEPILVVGNHDVQLKYLLQKQDFSLDMTFNDKIVFGDVFITHGHKLLDLPEKSKFLILGHEHPALLINDAKFKCYLITDYKINGENMGTAIIMPSFFEFVEGTHFSEDNKLSPYHKFFIKNYSKILVSKYNNKYLTLPLKLTEFMSFDSL